MVFQLSLKRILTGVGGTAGLIGLHVLLEYWSTTNSRRGDPSIYSPSSSMRCIRSMIFS